MISDLRIRVSHRSSTRARTWAGRIGSPTWRPAIVDARADMGGPLRAPRRSATPSDSARCNARRCAGRRDTADRRRPQTPATAARCSPSGGRARGGALDGARGLSGRSASHGSGDERRAASIARAAATEDRFKRQICRLNANFEGLPTGGGHHQAKLPIGGALARPRRRRVCNWRGLHPPALRGGPLVSR